MNTTTETILSDLPRRLARAVSEESPCAVAGLFTEDGSFWIADGRAPAGMAASGREGIEQLFAGWFSAIHLELSIEQPKVRRESASTSAAAEPTLSGAAPPAAGRR